MASIEKIAISITLSLWLIFLTGWLVFVCAFPLKIYWTLPALTTVILIFEWRSVFLAIKEDDVRALLKAQLLVSCWSVGLLALISTYSGGAWVADWWGHFERMSFFLDRGPKDILFANFDPLTSRPPFANIVTGVFTQLAGRDFVHYQVFSTLFASLAFTPAALLARRFGGNTAVPILALFFLANPMFAENATYTWTKLPAAFFILIALFFFLRAGDQAARTPAILFALALAAGLLTHYSAGPYALILASAWLVIGWRRRDEFHWRQTTVLAALVGSLALATWFGWCFFTYGVRGTLMTNTSVTDRAPDGLAQMHVILLNIKDTLVPHFLRESDSRLLEQHSPIGYLRDWFFQLYQVNFIFAFGCVAFWAIVHRLVKQASSATKAESTFWMLFISGGTLLGVAVHSGRETWGLAHICLQPLVLVGLAFLAAQWRHLSDRWRFALTIAAAVDIIAGIVFQFAAESLAFERWVSPNRALWRIVTDYSETTDMNFRAKVINHWTFLGDLFVNYRYATVAFLAMIALLAIRVASRPSTVRTMPVES